MKPFIPFTPEQVVLLRDATLIDNAEARALLDLDPLPDNITHRILKIAEAAIDANSTSRRDALIQIQHICLNADAVETCPGCGCDFGRSAMHTYCTQCGAEYDCLLPEYVCEHGYVRCDGCEECAGWAESWAEDCARREAALSPPVGDETEALHRARGGAELEALAAELERWAVNRERCHLDAKLLRKAARALLRGESTAATRRPSSSLPRERPPDEMATASEDLAARVIAGTATRADVEWLAESNEHLMARVAGLEAREAALRDALGRVLLFANDWDTADRREALTQASAALADSGEAGS